MPRFYLSELCEKIDEEYSLYGSSDNVYIEKISTPYHADESSMIFISPERTDKHEMIKNTKAKVVICDNSIDFQAIKDKIFICVKHPKYVFAKIGNALFVTRPSFTIHPTAIIHPEAKIAKNVHIGPYTYIGKCEIKANVVIHGNTYLYDNVTIHENVVIHAGCVIGADGLGHIRSNNSVYVTFPHIGGVVIEQNVSIGANSCIAKGALSDTVIKKNAVIDSFVQIGHNVLIEENVLILANVVVGGSSVIQQDVVLAIGAHICDYITVEKCAHIGPGAVIMNHVSAYSKVVSRAPMTLPQENKEKI